MTGVSNNNKGKHMSLTSLIRNDKELRDKIREAFSRPKLEKNKPLLVTLWISWHGI